MFDNTDIQKEITLPNILGELNQEGKLLMWSLLELEAVGNLGEDKSIPEFQNQIMKTREGFLLNWDELWDLSNKFSLVINCILIACKNKQAILDLTKKYKDTKDILPNCEIAIEINDGEFLNFYAKEKNVSTKITKRFGSLPLGVYRPIPRVFN